MLQIHFDDDEDTSFLYNDRVITGSRGFAALAPETAFNMFDDEYANHIAHVQCIQHMMTRRNNSFQLVLNSASVITISGYFCCMLGLDPTVTHTLSSTKPLQCRLPLSGHNYVSLELSIVYPQLNSLHSEKMSSTQLLSILPTPRSPGEIEYFTNPSIGGKCDISNNTLDSLSFRFMDEYGVSILSLRNFVITLVVVWPTATPVDDRYSLNQVRKQTMQNVRAQLRTHM